MKLRFCITLMRLFFVQVAQSQRGVLFVPYPEKPELRFYWELKELASFFDARKICRTEDSFLAILNTPHLWNWVYMQIEPQSITRGRAEFFFGLYAKDNRATNFMWVDGTPFENTFSIWEHNAQNKTLLADKSMLCPKMRVAMKVDRPMGSGPYISALFNRVCQEPSYFICQKGKAAPNDPDPTTSKDEPSAPADQSECCKDLQDQLKRVYTVMAFLGLGLLLFIILCCVILYCCLR